MTGHGEDILLLHGPIVLLSVYPSTSTNTSTIMIERRELMAKAAAWMQGRGWKARAAKRRGYEQSLLDYSLIKATPI